MSNEDGELCNEMVLPFVLLIHKKGNDSSENRIFANDCMLLKEALCREGDQVERFLKSKRIFTTATDNMESMILNLIAEREEEILKNLLPHCRENIMMEGRTILASMDFNTIHNLYLRFKLLKALLKCCTEEERLFPNGLKVLKAVLYRWQKAYEADPKTREKKHEDPQWLSDYRILANKITTPNHEHPFLKEYRKLFPKNADQFMFELADRIFIQSLYTSGFPNLEILDVLFAPALKKFFQDSFDAIVNAIKGARSAKIKSEDEDVTIDIDNVFLRISRALYHWQSNAQVRNRWIWVHCSGYSKDEPVAQETVNLFNDLINVSSELFGRTVISMDCCFPGFEKSSVNGTWAIYPDWRDDKIQNSPLYSDFTSLLSFALEGFHPEVCYLRMQSVSWDVNSCSCGTCTDYRQSRIIFTLPPGSETDVKIFLCGHCKTLRERCAGINQGRIFSSDILEYLKKHICSNSCVKNPSFCSKEREIFSLSKLR